MHVPEEHQKSILMRLSCGALAGLFGQTLTYPLDVVKRQMQVRKHKFIILSYLIFFRSSMYPLDVVLLIFALCRLGACKRQIMEMPDTEIHLMDLGRLFKIKVGGSCLQA